MNMNRLFWIGGIPLVVATVLLLTSTPNLSSAYWCTNSTSTNHTSSGINGTSGNITKSTLTGSSHISSLVIALKVQPCNHGGPQMTAEGS
jgi:hypothetical protein